MKNLPNIILIVLDTLRQDTFDGNLNSAPNIASLLQHSKYYSNAVSPASWTIPSHASILTGKYPMEHKMVYNFEDESFFKSISSLPENAVPIQQFLHKKGYNTLSLSANPLVGDHSAFDVGFDGSYTAGPFKLVEEFENSMEEVAGVSKQGLLRLDMRGGKSNLAFMRELGVRRSMRLLWTRFEQVVKLWRMHFPAEKGAKQVHERLLSLEIEEPFFIFTNLMEMHEPYSCLKDMGALESTFLKASLSKDFSATRETGALFSRLRTELAYNLSEADRFIGQLIQDLKSKRLYDDAIIIITSDHGQSLGEDGFVGHSYLLNDPIVNVPIVVKTGENTRSSEDRQVSTLGIYDCLKSVSEDGRWDFPRNDYVFSEAFGLNKARWDFRAGELSVKFMPQIRKRIWSEEGQSLTINGTTGEVEELSRRGKRLDIEENKPLINQLTDEMRLFVGNSDFNLP